MKDKGLMVRDLVRYEGEDYSITAIEANEESADIAEMCNIYRLGDYVYHLNDKDWSPIPLTKEIVEANDIPTNGDTFFFNEDQDLRLELCYLDNTLCWTINCAEYIILTFKYVHELQHAMRLCGIVNTANDFKTK